MAAATEANDIPTRDGKLNGMPVGAAKTIYAGTLVMLAAGYAEAGADTASRVFAGVAQETVDNADGAAGDEDVELAKVGEFKFASASALAAGDEGKEVFISDDQTVALAADVTNNVSVGHITEIVDANTAWVRIQPLKV